MSVEEQQAEEKSENPKIVKILSIDGGGIRGVIPAMILQRIEEMTGRPVVKMFDLISGTSTGGVMTLLLTKPKPGSADEPMYLAKDIVNLYVEHGKGMFQRSLWYKLISLNGWLLPKYPEKSVLSTLRGYLDKGERAQLKDALTDVLVTSYDIERRAAFFFRRCDAREKPHLNFYLSDAALGTSAAPTFFPTVKISSVDGSANYVLIDGGLVANNPSNLALAEAIWQHGNYTYPLVVSLGTGSYEAPISFGRAKRWGLIGWAPGILDVMFDGVSGAVDAIAEEVVPALSAPSFYFRFQIPLSKGDDAMDNSNPENIEVLQSLTLKMMDEKEADLQRLAKALMGEYDHVPGEQQVRRTGYEF
jgi:hypothetical protein